MKDFQHFLWFLSIFLVIPAIVGGLIGFGTDGSLLTASLYAGKAILCAWVLVAFLFIMWLSR